MAYIENQLFATINREFPIIRLYYKKADGSYTDSELVSAKQLAEILDEKVKGTHLSEFKRALASQVDTYTRKLRRGLKIEFVVD